MLETFKRIRNKILLSIFAIIISLSLLEIVLRTAENEKKLFTSDLKYWEISENEILIYELKANKNFNNGIVTNKDGFWSYSNINLTRKKPKNTYRIMVLGDSITFGYGIKPKNNYTTLLQNKLNELNSNANYEVINSAVSGYNTLQEVEQYRTKGKFYKPDLILIGFCINDAIINSGEILALNKQLNEQISKIGEEIKIPFLEEKNYLTKKSALIRFFYSKYQSKKTNENYQNLILNLAKNNQKKHKSNKTDTKKLKKLNNELKMKVTQLNYNENDLKKFRKQNAAALWTFHEKISIDAWSNVRYALETLNELVDNETDILIVIFPMLVNLDNYPFEETHNFFISEFDELNIKSLDLLPHFKEKTTKQLKLRNNDTIHPNSLGHKIASKAIYDYINNYLEIFGSGGGI